MVLRVRVSSNYENDANVAMDVFSEESKGVFTQVVNKEPVPASGSSELEFTVNHEFGSIIRVLKETDCVYERSFPAGTTDVRITLRSNKPVRSYYEEMSRFDPDTDLRSMYLCMGGQVPEDEMQAALTDDLSDDEEEDGEEYNYESEEDDDESGLSDVLTDEEDDDNFEPSDDDYSDAISLDRLGEGTDSEDEFDSEDDE